MTRRLLVMGLTLSAAVAVVLALSPARAQQGAGMTRKVAKTDAQWAKVLTPEQFAVTRQKATETAFTGKYWSNHAKGTYNCVCCGAPLFSSQTKFDSGTGWPSFFRPIDPRRIENAADNHLAEPRVEVMCRDCGAHLGHVFPDGPPPTGLRFCINSLSLKFVPATATGSGSTSSSKKSARTSSKSKAKGKAGSKTKGQPTPAEDEPATPPPGTDEAKPGEDKEKKGA
jgi:peptide-methionine (R)-S-oxide reductase